MVNWVQVTKQQLVHRLGKMAGLRCRAVTVDDAGTVMSIWAPKDKLPPTATESSVKMKKEERRYSSNSSRLSVVLFHGFAGDGIFTWVLQVVALAKHYDVYVPDLLFFGGSTSYPASTDRSPAFQAECVAAALRRLGVKRCAVVGFSYGGFVAFRMAEAHPGLVASVVATGSLVDMPRSTGDAILRRLGAVSLAELLLPHDVAGLRSLFAAGTHRKWWFPDTILKDYLELMIFNRKQRTELLEGMVTSDEDASAPSFRQDILLLWGENDSIFPMELASKLKEQLGAKATLRSISMAGHLVMLERPRVFNRRLREFLLQQQHPTPRRASG
ncbi:hypothetical protein HU200_059768 [Digitaria exilis]|uniref:AB hydrolase-1 domain-containing protein n=1 Tax=Digitaria exilis TaxID=1010633 RepID=A0A835E0T1_9POAL|nr:hypothetical protein HU200_059768 [Digitaria exilis]CAB3456977.1 unnamed protein product [Digitaria exilis]